MLVTNQLNVLLMLVTNQLNSTTHVSNQPAERTTHVSNQPAERTTHVSNQPAERTTHVSNQPAVKITSPSRGQQVPIVVQCLRCLVITSTNSSIDSKMVTTDNATSHGQLSIITKGIKQHHNVAGIVHLAHHGSMAHKHTS